MKAYWLIGMSLRVEANLQNLTLDIKPLWVKSGNNIVEQRCVLPWARFGDVRLSGDEPHHLMQSWIGPDLAHPRIVYADTVLHGVAMQETTGLDQFPVDELRVPAGFVPFAGFSHIICALSFVVSGGGRVRFGWRRFDDLLLV